MHRRLAPLLTALLAAVFVLAAATTAHAFPDKNNACTGCHGVDTAVVVSASQTSNNGTTATYSVSVSDAYGDGVTGWAVFSGTTRVTGAMGSGSFSVAVGKSYTVYGVAGAGGAGCNSIVVSPVAPPPPPVDTTPPTVSITSPSTGATVSGLVPLSANASDAGSGIARVVFKVDGTTIATDTASPYASAWDSTLASAGAHTIQAIATDGSGNSTTSSIQVSIAAPPPPADTTPPTVSITSPANGATVSGSVSIAASASDAGSGVARVVFKVDGTTIATDTASPYSAVWNATGAAPGAHTIQAIATDGSGNSTTSSIQVSIAAPPPPADTTPPTVSITSPANGATVSGSVSIAASASDAGSGVTSVEFRVDGQLIATDATGPYSAVWNATGAASGPHTIEVKAIDGSGNSTTSSIQVSIAAPPPPSPSTGTLTVSVRDGQGAPIAGVKVTARDAASGVRYTAITSAAGVATFSDLPLGGYNVSVRLRGYRSGTATVTLDAASANTSLTLVKRSAQYRAFSLKHLTARVDR